MLLLLLMLDDLNEFPLNTNIGKGERKKKEQGRQDEERRNQTLTTMRYRKERRD